VISVGGKRVEGMILISPSVVCLQVMNQWDTSIADQHSGHATEAFASLSVNVNGDRHTSEHGSDDQVRETINGEVSMDADRVNGKCCGS